MLVESIVICMGYAYVLNFFWNVGKDINVKAIGLTVNKRFLSPGIWRVLDPLSTIGFTIKQVCKMLQTRCQLLEWFSNMFLQVTLVLIYSKKTCFDSNGALWHEAPNQVWLIVRINWKCSVTIMLVFHKQLLMIRWLYTSLSTWKKKHLNASSILLLSTTILIIWLVPQKHANKCLTSTYGWYNKPSYNKITLWITDSAGDNWISGKCWR